MKQIILKIKILNIQTYHFLLILLHFSIIYTLGYKCLLDGGNTLESHVIACVFSIFVMLLDSLNSALVRLFTPGELANIINLGLFFGKSSFSRQIPAFKESFITKSNVYPMRRFHI